MNTPATTSGTVLWQKLPPLSAYSDTWSDDLWFLDQDNRTFINNPGMQTVIPGTAAGVALGGNLSTFNLLHGTQWMPSLKDSVLFIEMDGEALLEEFDRRLESLFLQPGFDGVQGVVVGRFQSGRHFDDEALKQLLKSKKPLSHLPVVINADFGHTTPSFTFPVGGQICLMAKRGCPPQLQVL